MLSCGDRIRSSIRRYRLEGAGATMWVRARVVHLLWLGLPLLLVWGCGHRSGHASPDTEPKTPPTTAPLAGLARLQAMSEVGRSVFLAETFEAMGWYEAALTANDDALSLIRRLQPDDRVFAILQQRMFLLGRKGFPDAARQGCEILLEEARKQQRDIWIAGAHFMLASLAMEQGSFEEAAWRLQEVSHRLEASKASLLDRALAEQLRWQASFLLPITYSLLGPSPASESSRKRLESFLHNRVGPWGPILAGPASVLDRQLASTRARAELTPELAEAHRQLTQGREHRLGQLDWRGQPLAELLQRCGPEPSTEEAQEPTSWFGRMGLEARAAKLYRRGDFAESALSWQSAARQAQRARNWEAAAMNLSSSSVALWRLGRFDPAIERAAEAAACLERSLARMTPGELLLAYSGGHRRLFYEGLVEMLTLESHYAEALAVSELARARLLLQSLAQPLTSMRPSLRSPLRKPLESLERTASEREEAMVQATLEQRRQIEREVLKLRREYEALWIEASAADPSLGALAAPAEFDLRELQALLSPDTSLVSYFVTDQQTHAWVVDHDGIQWFPLPRVEKGLSLPLCFAETLRSTDRSAELLRGCTATDASAESLYQQYFAPLRRAVRGTHLIIVPHGALNYIPFSALKDPQTRRYLLEDFTIAYAPSVRALELFDQKSSLPATRTLVLGAPSRYQAGPEPGRGMEREAEAVARLLGTSALLHGAASESALRSEIPSTGLVHLAAHSSYLPSNPRFSRILLAPDPEHDGPDDDGNLEVHEILSQLDLGSVRLVVLSACSTALGETSGGDEIVGLSRAFLHAGASSVISTLWNVDDAASTELMIVFYRHLVQGKPVAEALRAAQLALLRQPRFAEPRLWAAFVFTGSPGLRWRLR